MRVTLKNERNKELSNVSNINIEQCENYIKINMF